MRAIPLAAPTPDCLDSVVTISPTFTWLPAFRRASAWPHPWQQFATSQHCSKEMHFVPSVRRLWKINKTQIIKVNLPTMKGSSGMMVSITKTDSAFQLTLIAWVGLKTHCAKRLSSNERELLRPSPSKRVTMFVKYAQIIARNRADIVGWGYKDFALQAPTIPQNPSVSWPKVKFLRSTESRNVSFEDLVKSNKAFKMPLQTISRYLF